VNTTRNQFACLALLLSALSTNALTQISDDGDDEILADAEGIELYNHPVPAMIPASIASRAVTHELQRASYNIRHNKLEPANSMTAPATTRAGAAKGADSMTSACTMSILPVVTAKFGGYYQVATTASALRASGQVSSNYKRCDTEHLDSALTNKDGKTNAELDRRHIARENIRYLQGNTLPAEAVAPVPEESKTWMW